MSKSFDTPHETNLYMEYLLVDAFEEKMPSADFFALMMLLVTILKTILNALRPALKPAPIMACGRLDV
jgi:hypothetical protein